MRKFQFRADCLLPLAYSPLACLLFALLPFSSIRAQQQITIQHSCSFDGEESQTDFYVFDASQEADRIVGRVVNAVGLAKNFIVKSADCTNALATTEGNQRYILYNTTFLEKFKKDSKTKWAAYCVLAHEIGHHLNNHNFNLSDMKKRKSNELEADRFAGSALFTLGASLEEAQAGIDILQTTGETATHPPARARAEAIASGWKNAQELQQQRSDNAVERPAEISDQPKNTLRPPDEKPKDNQKMIPPSPDKMANPNQQVQSQQPFNPQDFTAVSDQLVRSTMVGQWECAYFNGVANVNNIVTLNADGSGVGMLYLNGILSQTTYITWQIQQGQYIETYVATGQYAKFTPGFNGNNYMSLYFWETNGPVSVPYGSVFYFTRRF